MIYVPMRPVLVWDGPVMRSLDDVDRAVNFLMLKWPPPFAETPLHLAARVAALAVLDGQEPVEALYEAITAAAREADILADLGEQNAADNAPVRKWALTRRNQAHE